MRGSNICEHGNLHLPADTTRCRHCLQPMVLDAAGCILLWRLSYILDSVLGPDTVAIVKVPFSHFELVKISQ